MLKHIYVRLSIHIVFKRDDNESMIDSKCTSMMPIMNDGH